MNCTAILKTGLRQGQFCGRKFCKIHKRNVSNIMEYRFYNRQWEILEIKLEENDENIMRQWVMSEKIKKFNAGKHVFKPIISLLGLLTLGSLDEFGDILDRLNYLKNNQKLLEAFEEQICVWWSELNDISYVYHFIRKYCVNDIRAEISDYLTFLYEKYNDIKNNPCDLLEFYNEIIYPRYSDIKCRAEVFTPLKFIDTILDELDHNFKIKNKGQSIFKIKDFIWFEPASGMGNFSIKVYERLLIGLEDTIPCFEERQKHIISNMLYMSELNKKNIIFSENIFKNILGKHIVTCNIHNGNTLTLNPYEYWGIQNFDVIVGNPPFQEKVGPSKTEPKWDKFTSYNFKYLKQNGFMAFIQPSGWRNVEGRFKYIKDMILCKNIMYLEIHDTKDGNQLFGHATDYDWFIIQNRKSEQNTKVQFLDKTLPHLNLTKIPFIPNSHFEEILSLIALPHEEKVEILYDSSLYESRKISKDQVWNSYPCVYTINKDNEPTLYYTFKKSGHFGVPKFIWSNGAGSLLDLKGEYGLTQFAYAIVDTPSNLKKIDRVFQNKKFRSLVKSCSIGQNDINYKVIRLFKKEFWNFI